MKSARFLEPADAELEEHITYYEQQVDGLGDRFEREVEHAVSLAAEHHRIGTPLTKRVRKIPLRTFPFNLIYVAEQDDIIIVAVAHHKRRPGYWRARLGYSR